MFCRQIVINSASGYAHRPLDTQKKGYERVVIRHPFWCLPIPMPFQVFLTWRYWGSLLAPK